MLAEMTNSPASGPEVYVNDIKSRALARARRWFHRPKRGPGVM
jgi:hypothetical protein